MQEENDKQPSVKNITRTVLALKAARISMGFSRKQAAEKCSCTVKAFERIENGRNSLSDDRVRRLVESMGMGWSEFLRFKESPEKALAQIDAYNLERTLARKPRRNLYKIVTKEVRAVRVLRKRRGISQNKASEICGFKECTFGLIEAGRTDLTDRKIDLIVHALGYKRSDFDKIIQADIVADEIISEITVLLDLLDDQGLYTILTMAKALTKK
jgi:transcriptional regulator with XRE-family HTH domain